RLVERLQQLALLNPHQITRLPLHIPDLHVRENLQRRSKPVLDSPRPRRGSAQPPRRSAKKTYQAIRLTQRESLQDDRFCFPGGHEQSARRRCAEHVPLPCPRRTHTQNENFYHTRSSCAMPSLAKTRDTTGNSAFPRSARTG